MVAGLVSEPNTTCEELERSDYENIVWTAAAEFPGEFYYQQNIHTYIS